MTNEQRKEAIKQIRKNKKVINDNMKKVKEVQLELKAEAKKIQSGLDYEIAKATLTETIAAFKDESKKLRAESKQLKIELGMTEEDLDIMHDKFYSQGLRSGITGMYEKFPTLSEDEIDVIAANEFEEVEAKGHWFDLSYISAKVYKAIDKYAKAKGSQ